MQQVSQFIGIPTNNESNAYSQVFPFMVIPTKHVSHVTIVWFNALYIKNIFTNLFASFTTRN